MKAMNFMRLPDATPTRSSMGCAILLILFLELIRSVAFIILLPLNDKPIGAAPIVGLVISVAGIVFFIRFRDYLFG